MALSPEIHTTQDTITIGAVDQSGGGGQQHSNCGTILSGNVRRSISSRFKCHLYYETATARTITIASADIDTSKYWMSEITALC